MVGPRHMLTVSHGISWNGDGSAGWVQFRPSYFSSDAPFGEARGIHWYAYQQVTPPTIDGNEGLEDYCLIVLDRRMGDLVGWMGSRTYSEDWDSEGVWRHIGYPADLAGAEQPSYRRDISLDGRHRRRARDLAPSQAGRSSLGGTPNRGPVWLVFRAGKIPPGMAQVAVNSSSNALSAG